MKSLVFRFISKNQFGNFVSLLKNNSEFDLVFEDYDAFDEGKPFDIEEKKIEVKAVQLAKPLEHSQKPS